MDSFAGLETFARVVESGSFTGAAARLQTAKSSVSDGVRALEERLGVRLLERTTSGRPPPSRPCPRVGTKRRDRSNLSAGAATKAPDCSRRRRMC